MPSVISRTKTIVDALVDRLYVRMGERWPHRGEQLEFLAHRRHHPGRIAARIGVMPDRTHDPAVEPAQRLFGDRRQRMTVLFVPAFADRQRHPIHGKPGRRGGRLDHFDTFGNDFETDVVAVEHADFHFSSPRSMPRCRCGGDIIAPR
jgi:hypothetical protein